MEASPMAPKSKASGESSHYRQLSKKNCVFSKGACLNIPATCSHWLESAHDVWFQHTQSNGLQSAASKGLGQSYPLQLKVLKPGSLYLLYCEPIFTGIVDFPGHLGVKIFLSISFYFASAETLCQIKNTSNVIFLVWLTYSL